MVEVRTEARKHEPVHVLKLRSMFEVRWEARKHEPVHVWRPRRLESMRLYMFSSLEHVESVQAPARVLAREFVYRYIYIYIYI